MVGEASGRMQKADCRDEIALPAAMLAWLKYRKQRTRNSRKRFLVFFCSLFVKARVVYRLHLVGYSVIERSEGRCESGVVQEEISDMAERFCCNAGPLLSYLGFKRKRNELESSYFIHTSLIDFCVLKH